MTRSGSSYSGFTRRGVVHGRPIGRPYTTGPARCDNHRCAFPSQHHIPADARLHGLTTIPAGCPHGRHNGEAHP